MFMATRTQKRTDLKSALADCKRAAKKGYGVALDSVTYCTSTCSEAAQSLNVALARVRSSRAHASDTQEQLIRQLNVFVSDLKVDQDKFLKNIEELQGKLGDFSITLFGRTMTGKSTLMEILTQGDGTSIGKGAQRTTRDVRQYYWNGLAITDVPGVVAFEGQQDEEVALATALYADLVLFLITDDAPQPAEAFHLANMKRLDKPIIGICNIKATVDDELDLAMFLADGDAPFAPERIRKISDQFMLFARQHVPTLSVEFIPVHLRCRYLADRATQAHQRETLLKASRFEGLESRIVEEVRTRGAFLRTRTFLNQAVGPMLELQEKLLAFGEENARNVRVIRNKQAQLQRWADAFMRDGRRDVGEEAAALIDRLRQEVPGFVEAHVEDKHVADKWRRVVEGAGIPKAAAGFQRALADDAKAQLSEFVRELQAEIKLTGALAALKEVKHASIVDGRRIWNWGVAITSGALGLAAFAFPPLAIVAGAVAILGGLLSGLFQSREGQLREARLKLQRQLEAALDRQEEKMNRDMSHWLNEAVGGMIGGVQEELAGIGDLLDTLAQTQRQLAWRLNEKVQRLHRLVISEALGHLGQRDVAKLVKGVARVPGAGTVLSTRLEAALPADARRALASLLEEPVDVVVDTGEPTALVPQVLGMAKSRLGLRLDVRARVLYARLGELDGRTRLKVRLAQQLTGLQLLPAE
jgi:hypothetical protein